LVDCPINNVEKYREEVFKILPKLQVLDMQYKDGRFYESEDDLEDDMDEDELEGEDDEDFIDEEGEEAEDAEELEEENEEEEDVKPAKKSKPDN
jgi:hypothetical protein